MTRLQEMWQDLECGKKSIGIIGLGYVGLPLACLLAEKFKIIGFDIKDSRVKELKSGFDRTREVMESARLKQSNLRFTSNLSDLRGVQFFIVAVPTPIDDSNRPDLTPVVSAARSVGSILQPGSIVTFESTVYPGLTETICKDELEKASGLSYKTDFLLGYSPERINPGDHEHTIDRVIKVVSASDAESLELVAKVYGAVVTAGVHKAPNIRTAEAAKVIENVQRDINIALMNELAVLFERVGIDTLDVLEAAGTKWNFLNFRPGLVGGHCIGVDPYYLTHLAEKLKFYPQVILAGRRINDSLARFLAHKTMELILQQPPEASGRRLKVGILGVTFKENVPDLRNTKVVDIGFGLEKFGVEVHYVDPVAYPEEFSHEYQRELVSWDDLPACDALIVATKHREFVRDFKLPRLAEKLTSSRVVVDVKSILDRSEAAEVGINLWRL